MHGGNRSREFRELTRLPGAAAKGTQKGTQKAGHIHLLKKRPAWHGDNSLFFGLRAAVWIPSDGIPVGQVLALNEVQKAQGMNLSEIAETDAAALTVTPAHHSVATCSLVVIWDCFRSRSYTRRLTKRES